MEILYQHIEKHLQNFTPISLEQMDAVRLLNRLDTKFFFNSKYIPLILDKARPFYQVLEINEKRQFQYYTKYFDTPEFRLYHDHHNGKLNRYKIRQRKYDTGSEYFEIKFKNNKGQTLKSRIENNEDKIFNKHTISFLENYTPYHANELTEILDNRFIRITLVSNTMTERATIDYNIEFFNQNSAICYPYIGILEIKQDFSAGYSPLMRIMHELHILPNGFSKYCTGVVSLYQPHVKTNAFKPKIIKIKNLKEIC